MAVCQFILQCKSFHIAILNRLNLIRSKGWYEFKTNLPCFVCVRCTVLNETVRERAERHVGSWPVHTVGCFLFNIAIWKLFMGEDRGVHRVLVGKPEGKRPLGRPRRRWEDNIKMDLQEVGGGRGAWLVLAQDRDRWRELVGTVRDFRVS